MERKPPKSKRARKEKITDRGIGAQLNALKKIHKGMRRRDEPVPRQIVVRQVRKFIKTFNPIPQVERNLLALLGQDAKPSKKPGIKQFNRVLTRDRAGIRQFDYLSEQNTTPSIDAFAEAITKAASTTGARSVWVRLWDFKNRVETWRVIAIENFRNPRKLRKLLDDPETFIGDYVIEGSDPDYNEISRDWTLDTTVFKMGVNKARGGCNNTARVRYQEIANKHCVSLRSTNENCAIQAFKYSKQNTERADIIRKKLNIPKGKISIQQIPLLEQYFEIKCCVNTPDGSVYGDNDAPLQLMLKDEHYWVIEDTKPEPKKRPNPKTRNTTQPKIQTWFYDFETHYDGKNLIPYSVACVTGYGDERKTFFQIGSDCAKNLERWLHENADHTKRNILVGFNNSKFDDYLLIPHLVNSNNIKSKGVFMANGATLKVQFSSFQTIDMCRFLNTSLANACRAFKCSELKGNCDHNAIQQKFFEFKNECEETAYHQFHQWIANQPNIREYNIQDCVCLQELFDKFDTAVFDLIGLRFYDFMTISQMGLKSFSNTQSSKLVKNPKDLETWQFIRSAIVAGRSEIFQRACCEEEMMSLDVKSLYPYAMRACEFPIGQEIKTSEYKPDKFGVYNVVIRKQPEPRKTNMNITPYRDTEGKNPLNWKSREVIECVLCSVDIQTHLDSGSDIEILDGVYWEQSSRVFAGYVEPLEKEKSRQDELKDAQDPTYNQAMREAIKLLLNSLSGKVLQNRHDEEVCISTSAADTHRFSKEHNNVISPKIIEGCNAVLLHGNKKEDPYVQKYAKPCHLGVFIYAWARRHMYLSAIGRIEDKYCTDTDSVHIPKRVFEQYRHDTPGFGRLFMGTEFGNYENEIEFITKRSYYIAPKVYALIGHARNDPEKPVCKLRFKGVRSTDKRLDGGEQAIKDFKALPLEQQLSTYLTLPTALNEDLYKAMLGGETVNVVTSQIIRKPFGESGRTNAFGLQQRFMVKTIS